MNTASRFVGRDEEQAALRRHLQEAGSGRGAFVLVTGDAGVGKSRLVDKVLRESGVLAHTTSAPQGDPAPYGPVVQILRSHLRTGGRERGVLGPLAAHLAPLLPELGPPPTPGTDRGTLFEAVRCAFAAMASAGVTAVFFDDLHWGGEATLDLLLALQEGLQAEPLLLLGACRSDEIPRGHPARRFRAELRRKRRLHEVTVGPLPPAESRELIAGVLGNRPSQPLVESLYDRAQGVPFFLEELAGALRKGGRLRPGADGLEMAPGVDAPLPESIRDAVLLRTQGLGSGARRALEFASVLGVRFDPGLVGDEQALLEAFEGGLLVEAPGGSVAFRHALAREAIYHEIPVPRRRTLHQEVARSLEGGSAPPELLASHWLAAREFGPARRALVESAEAYCHVHAYREAMRAARHALELWPAGEDQAGRLALLDRLAGCAELSGDLAEASRAWREVAEAREKDGNLYALGETKRRLATVYGLQGAWERALGAHREAATAFAEHGLPGEAAAERLVAADHLEGAGDRTSALELVLVAADEAERGGRPDLVALALGLEGQLRVALGEGERGLDVLRKGLDLALAHHLTGPIAELHYRLAWALGETSAYESARSMFEAGIEFCHANGISEAEHQCLACYAGVMLEMGEWDRTAEVCRHLLEAPERGPIIDVVAGSVLGVLEGLRGRPGPARRLLRRAEAGLSRTPPNIGLDLSILWGLAVADALEGATEAATERIRALRRRWEKTDDLFYVMHPLRWACTFLAGEGSGSEARACADALASVAARKASPEALAALAHALGECALLEGDPPRAVEHFDQALELLARIGIAFQHAHTLVRHARALAMAGDGGLAADRLVEAHQTARKLGARPLAADAARGLRELGGSVEERLGRRAAGELDRAGLTRRELQVLRFVDRGQTNREIARELFLSPRTIEMHVSNALLKLGCGSRTAAAHRARELGVLG